MILKQILFFKIDLSEFWFYIKVCLTFGKNFELTKTSLVIVIECN